MHLNRDHRLTTTVSHDCPACRKIEKTVRDLATHINFAHLPLLHDLSGYDFDYDELLRLGLYNGHVRNSGDFSNRTGEMRDVLSTEDEDSALRSYARGRSYEARSAYSSLKRRDSSASSVRSMIDDRMRMADEERGRTRNGTPQIPNSPFRDESPFMYEYAQSRRGSASFEAGSVGNIEPQSEETGDTPVFLPLPHFTRSWTVESVPRCDRCRQIGNFVSGQFLTSSIPLPKLIRTIAPIDGAVC